MKITSLKPITNFNSYENIMGHLCICLRRGIVWPWMENFNHSATDARSLAQVAVTMTLVRFTIIKEETQPIIFLDIYRMKP